MTKRGAKRRSYLVTKLETRTLGLAGGCEQVQQRYYLRYNSAAPELDDGARGADRRTKTNWTPVISGATKFRTPLDALAIAIQYDGGVVRYNGDNRSWSQLSEAELRGDFG